MHTWVWEACTCTPGYGRHVHAHLSICTSEFKEVNLFYPKLCDPEKMTKDYDGEKWDWVGEQWD